MREARILRGRRARFRAGGRRTSNKGDWRFFLVLTFGVVGTMGLVVLLWKMKNVKIKNRRSLIAYSMFMLVSTLCMCIPAIVFLALDPSLPVLILAIISICFLILPFLIWISIAVKKSRNFGNEDDDDYWKEINTQQEHTMKTVDTEEQPYPTDNFRPQASVASYPTAHSVVL